MEMQAGMKNDFVILKMKGRMDAATGPAFEKECLSWIDDKGARRVIVDMAGLEYISSAGLRSILSISMKLRAQEGEIRFANLSGMVKEVFTIAGFSTMFQSYDSVDQALA